MADTTLAAAGTAPGIERVGVVGCGQMGAGIAEVCARSGLDVLVAEADAEAVRRGEERIAASLARAVRAGKLTEQEAADAAARLRYTADLGDLADRQLVVEAVAEIEEVKAEVLAKLDAIVADPDAILATNTSSIPIMRLGTATSRPAQVIGIHFFNPVPVLPLVELVPSLLTSETTKARAQHFVVDQLGKHAVPARDRAGFVVNALLIPYLLSAVRMAESGFAAPEDIDAGMVMGCAHPMGPLRLADLIGLDTVRAAAEAMYEEFKEPLYTPPALLLRMVEAGRLGRKTGRGFYDYTAA
ncbi:3-hydroxybutyryl-CoA dehydrogenase [Streptacidiphilus jiangxiensis]|uniref:3-hydroxybutyryl-CoA dehydrogenase n=1 Tax=Streptacidiphilus jiangxiensis TaxID=235985 RepID=A0A1H7NAT2_STRJI|nr:3-hydroxybutyryl-CoA dehydrogenase [Streptacidiphilus jiangxiensis]SEL20590.1 3-hydroxybutyryl-CoA dehydrogenase [Streptacidiphilus jiangxiensis]